MFNYIPHKKPRNITFNTWYNWYYKDLCSLYSIFCDIITQRHNPTTDLTEQKLFTDFCFMIYNKSSKYRA